MDRIESLEADVSVYRELACAALDALSDLTRRHRLQTTDVARLNTETRMYREEQLLRAGADDEVTALSAFIDRVAGKVPSALDQAHQTFRRWLGEDYDLDALDAVLAAAAVERLDGRPAVAAASSPGPATRRPRPCRRSTAPARIVTSTISSRGRAAVRHAEAGARPRTPPADCSARSATAACWSSRT